MTTQNRTRKTSVLASVSKRRAGDERELLFAALEAFVNAGDTLKEFQSFRAQWPNFFPARIYEDGEDWAAEDASVTAPIRWYKHQLRKVWEGRDPQGVRLAILLGIERPPYSTEEDIPPAGEARAIQLDPTFKDDAYEWLNFTRRGLEVYRSRLDASGQPVNAIGTLPESHPAPDWRTGEIRYEFGSDFQRAVYALMRESWRARICRICGKYFIASKPARQFCSPKCFGAAKRHRDLDYWKREGSTRRDTKRRRRKP
jgi:hypothetical protein